jgi:hypothetical protein
MCGERDPTTLDHALPRAHWPEFAVLPDNLVPACADCNYRKGERVLDADGQALFIHPYRDRVDEIQFLDATIDTSSGFVVVQYFIRAATGVSPPLIARLRRHFKALGLDELYRLKANPEALEKTMLVSELHEAGVAIEEISRTLEAQARRTAEVLGNNHWRTVLHRGLAQSEHFICGISD